jgi:hypothetical protein
MGIRACHARIPAGVCAAGLVVSFLTEIPANMRRIGESACERPNLKGLVRRSASKAAGQAYAHRPWFSGVKVNVVDAFSWLPG